MLDVFMILMIDSSGAIVASGVVSLTLEGMKKGASGAKKLETCLPLRTA